MGTCVYDILGNIKGMGNIGTGAVHGLLGSIRGTGAPIYIQCIEIGYNVYRGDGIKREG